MTAVVLAGAFALGSGGVATAATPTPPPRDTSQFACPPSQVPNSGFTDTGGNTFEAQIDCLAWYGITHGGPNGLPPNQYGPALTVSRAQMATFIARFFDYVDPGRIPAYDGTNQFVDVADDSNHVANINRLADAGIVHGGPGGGPANTYGPSQDVARDQMASFIGRMLGNLLEANMCPGTIDDYFDDDTGDVHEDCINGMADVAIVQGDGAGHYAPTNPVTRAQMSGFLMRAMDLLVEHGLASTPT